MVDPYQSPKSTVETPQQGADAEFRFAVDGHEIVARGGLASGLERIYLDGELVSRKRSFARLSRHDLTIGERAYVVAFAVKNPFGNKIICELQHDGEILRRLRCEIKARQSVLLVSILILVAVSFGLGWAKASWGLSDALDVFVYTLMAVTFFAATALAVKKGEKLVTELPVDR